LGAQPWLQVPQQ